MLSLIKHTKSIERVLVPREWLLEPEKVPGTRIEVLSVHTEDYCAILHMGQTSPRASIGGITLHRYDKEPHHEVSGVSRVTLRVCSDATHKDIELRVRWKSHARWDGTYKSLYFFAPIEIDLDGLNTPVEILDEVDLRFTDRDKPFDESRSLLYLRQTLNDHRLQAWTDRVMERLPSPPSPRAIDTPECCLETLVAPANTPVPECEVPSCPVLHNDYPMTVLEAGSVMPIQFPGRLVACGDTRELQPDTVRVYGILRLYETFQGTYICEHITKCRDGQLNPVSTFTVVPPSVSNLHQTLTKVFGPGPITSSLLQDAGITDVKTKEVVNG